MEEIWKNIVGYEGYYQVSNIGRIKSINRLMTNNKNRRGVLLKQRLNKGYFVVNLCRHSKMKTTKVHRLVAIAFIPNPNNYPYINHKDGIRNNNNLNNIEWCDAKMNSQHAWDNGLCIKLKGNLNPNKKLNEEQVIKIRKLYQTKLSSRVLGSMFGVTKTQILHIVNRKSWSHIA